MSKLIILFSVMVASGCSWQGYRPPTSNDFHAVNNNGSTYVIGVQNFDTNNELSMKRLDSIKRSVSDVQNIFQSKEFESLLVGSTWVASCDGDTVEKVSGDELVKDLRALSVKVSIFPKKPWLAIALTDMGNNRIAIDPSRIDLSSNGEIIDSSWLIETTAHELTHMIKENNTIKYRDKGHGKDGCLDNQLASYRVGKSAQAVWIHNRVSN